jgi:hypothetical protein
MSEEPKGRGESKKAPAQGAEFIPGAESDEDFQKVLVLLTGWVNAGVVHAEIDPDGDVTFKLPGEMRDLFGAETPSGLKSQHVLGIIRIEIPSLIGAGLAENPKRYLMNRIPEDLHERLDALVQRSQKVVTSLVSKDLKERILLRRTTLSYVVKEIQAISGSYVSRSSSGEKANLPFTSVEFTFVRPRSPRTAVFTPEGESMLFAVGQKDEIQVRVDLHRDDIKLLVEDLTGLIEQEERVEAECAHAEK